MVSDRCPFLVGLQWSGDHLFFKRCSGDLLEHGRLFGFSVSKIQTETLLVAPEIPFLGIRCYSRLMVVIGAALVESYFAERAGHKGVKVARSQYEAWLQIARRAQWRNPEDVKAAYPKSELQYFSETLQNRAGVFRIDPTIFKSSS
jgi:hypothetical protein